MLNIRTLFLLVTTTLMACQTLSQVSIQQGAQGYVYLRTGDQMPAIGRQAAKPKGVSREVYFYQPTTSADVVGSMPLIDSIRTRLVLKIKSNADGRYQAGLPAGQYSVFVKEDGKFFAATTNGEGVMSPVVVSSGTVTPFDLTITLKATY